mmetsp:Transcript_32754/g.48509  ORF Transcript_32754/g.48509 Transcript_32754/m.48509 type:complete len:292 (-) Transcript_32754:19-894(-)
MLNFKLCKVGFLRRQINFAIGAFVTFVYVRLLDRIGGKFIHSAKSAHTGNTMVSIPALVGLVCSSLNTLSHAAVVTGVLDDTYVFSILLGVGFDLLSSFLYIMFWVKLLLSTEIDLNVPSLGDTFLGLLCIVILVHQWLVHLRAIFLSSSVTRLRAVVTSAFNNIRGDPGPRFSDHIFAFLDIGYHLYHISVTSRIMELNITNVLLTSGVLLLILVSFKTNGKPSSPTSQISSGLLIVNEEGKTICCCESCCGFTSFSIDIKRKKFCTLWFQSFGQLSSLLTDLEGETKRL